MNTFTLCRIVFCAALLLISTVTYSSSFHPKLTEDQVATLILLSLKDKALASALSPDKPCVREQVKDHFIVHTSVQKNISLYINVKRKRNFLKILNQGYASSVALAATITNSRSHSPIPKNLLDDTSLQTQSAYIYDTSIIEVTCAEYIFNEIQKIAATL